MAWDKAGEAHEGESLFALLPSDSHGREGLLLRDRGYAETAPVAGHFSMDDRDALLLRTSYETMNTLERFSFAGRHVRLRTSTVEGLSNTASFCVETRIGDPAVPEEAPPAPGEGGRIGEHPGPVGEATPLRAEADVLSPMGW
jgi:hypothetical protein